MKKHMFSLIFIVVLFIFIFSLSAFADEPVVDVNNTADTYISLSLDENTENTDKTALKDIDGAEDINANIIVDSASDTEEKSLEDNQNSNSQINLSEQQSNIPNYVVTISDEKNSMDIQGGSRTLISGILRDLGYDINNTSVITVDMDTVDTSVISVNDTENGPELMDKGPFSEASKKLVVCIDGERIELTVVDPTLISGNQTCQSIENAFNNITDGKIKLSGDTDVSADGQTIVLSCGVHELFLESYIFNLRNNTVVVGDGVTLNIYCKENESVPSSKGYIQNGCVQITNGGILNYVHETVQPSSISNSGGATNILTYNGGISSLPSGNVVGYYYLTSDIEADWEVKYATAIDLNGHVLKGMGSKSVINITGSYGNLTLTDSDPESMHLNEKLPKGGVVTGGNSACGGGINNKGVLTLNGGSVSNNYSTKYGGGIYNTGTFIMNGGSVCNNESSASGGGISSSETFIMNAGAVYNNKSYAKEGAGNGGGGVHCQKTFIMNGGTVYNNECACNGGGIYNNPGNFTMNGGTVSGNKAHYGGGVFNRGNFIMNDGIICSNESLFDVTSGLSKPETQKSGAGGGVYNIETFTMNGGTIQYNNACNGGGLTNSNTSAGGTTGKGICTVYGNISNNSSFTARGEDIFYSSSKLNIGGNLGKNNDVHIYIANSNYLLTMDEFTYDKQYQDYAGIKIKKSSYSNLVISTPYSTPNNTYINNLTGTDGYFVNQIFENGEYKLVLSLTNPNPVPENNNDDSSYQESVMILIKGINSVYIEAGLKNKTAMLPDIGDETIKYILGGDASSVSVIIDFKDSKREINSLALKTKNIGAVAGAHIKNLKLSFNLGNIIFNNRALDTFGNFSNEDSLIFTMEEVTFESLSENKKAAAVKILGGNSKYIIVDTYVMSKKSKIEDLKDGSATIEINPDILTSLDADGKNLIIYAIYEDGTFEETAYGMTDGNISITSSKPCTYIISDRKTV